MSQHFSGRRARQQRQVAKHLKKVDANHFFNLLTSPQLLEQVEAHLPEHRERKFPPTVTLAMFLGQVMSADGSCQNAVNETLIARALSGVAPGSVSTSAYCQARARLPEAMVSALARQTAALLSEHTPQGWLWRGRPVKLVDGTTVWMPDTPQNQGCFPQSEQQQAGTGFPMSRLVGVISLSHGAVLDAAMGAYKGKGTSEHGLFRRLSGCFVAGDVMLADGYFCSYFLIAQMQRLGVDVLFEQNAARITDFRRGEQLGVRDHRVSWQKPQRPEWMSVEDYCAYPDGITVREVKVGKKVLVTTFLNPRQTPKGELDRLFWQRWNVELDLRNIKRTLGMERFSCKTPAMVEKEMWVYVLAYNLIRLLMAEAAQQAGVLPRQLSFKHTLQIWVAWSARQFLSEASEDTAGLFMLIAQVRVGDRAGRIEPRMIKRRPNRYTFLGAPRWKARRRIKRRGHAKKLRA
jgi:DDE family transposase